MKYLKILFFLTFFLSVQLLSAQNWRLVMDIAVTEDGKKMPGAEIKLFKNGKLSETLKTDNKGTVDVPLLPNAIYIISISGPGYIDKKLEIDTRNVNPEDIGSGDIFYPAEVDIFKKIEGLNLDILDEPIGKIWYDDKFGGFTYNKDYTLQRQAALSALKESYLKKKEEEKNKLLKGKELYAEAIKKGDKAFKEENWEVAKAEYEKAQALDPFETYPTDQLGAIATKQVKKSADEENYKAAIMKADAALKIKNYKDAIAEYQKAVSYKPDDKYATDKLAEAQTLAINVAKLEQNYLSAIEKGDNFLMANKLEEAKVAFEEAQQLKPSESYPKSKLGEINSILTKSNQVETDFQEAIKAGDAALAQSDLSTAKASYEKALGLKPSESYPKAQLGKIDQLLAEAAKKEQSYITAVEQADNLLQAKDYEGAKKSYELASQIKPTELYPKNKIKEISNYLAENAMKEKEYVAAISTADAALASQRYSEAKSSYQKALSIKADESYPKGKIAEIDNVLLKQKEQEEKYQSAIASADKAFSEKNYESAKASYNQAQALKPSEAYPKNKLVEIKKLETDLANIEKDYAAAIQMADAALTAKKYEEASTYYQQALSYKANESYPKEKLLEVETQLAAAKKAEYDYNLAIEAGDKAFSANKYELAKSEYNRALSLKPNEAYASDKLAAIDQLLAENQAKEQQYNDAISAADEAFTAKSWATAEKHYQAALKIKLNESYPKQKLEEISNILAEQTAKDNKYKEVLASADQAFAAKNYEQARKSYEAALDLKANENYPSEKIAEIAQLLTKQAEEKEAIRLENERKAKIEQDYIAAITEGDKQFEAKAYEQSRAKYEEALSLKPDESYPNKRIAEIEGLRQKELANMKEAELDASYEAAIGAADAAFSAKDYNLAKSSYKEALAIKANETYPLEKLEEIKLAEKQLALEKEKKAEAEKTAQLQSQYDAAILKADKAFANSNFELATASYQSALNLKPNESYPQEKMEEISKKISELEENAVAEKLAREKAAKLETSYLAAIATADEALKSEDLSTAKNSYNKALELKPNESYPQQKLQEIASYLEQQAAKDSERAAALAAEKAKIENEYNSLLATADEKLANGAYKEAITDYQAAIKVKPSESYPRTKVDEINALLAEKKAKEEQLLQQNEKLAKLEKAYNQAITEADGFFEAKDWENAKTAYFKASELQPSNEYPKKQLQLVQSNILEKQEALSKASKNQKKVEDDLMYATLVKNADLSFETADYQLAKRDYQEALSIKPNESYPKEQLQIINKKLDEAIFPAEEKQHIIAEEKEEEIIVQSGERSSINNDTEERIDQLYKEMWEEKKVGKESYFSSREEQQKKKANELKKLEEENKLNAIERLEDISISYEKSMVQSTKLNTQNHQNVQNVQKRLNEANQNLEHNSKRQREHFYSDQQDLQNNINKSNEQSAEKQKKLNYYEDANDSQTAFHKDMNEEHKQVQTAAALRIKSVQDYKDRQVVDHQESIKNKAGQLTQRKEQLQNLEEKRKGASEERINTASAREYTYEKRFAEDQKQTQDKSMEQIKWQAEYYQQKQAAQGEIIKSRSESLASRKAELQEMEEKRKNAAEERTKTAAAREYSYENRFVENQQQFQDKSMEQIEAQSEYFRQKEISQIEAVKIRSERLADRKSELQEMEERRKSTAEERAQNAVVTDYATFDKKYVQNQNQAQATAVSLIEQQIQFQKDRETKQQEEVKRKSELLAERKEELENMEVQRRKAAEQRALEGKQQDYSVNNAKFVSNQEKVQSDNISRIEAMENRKKEVENLHIRSISEKAERLDQRKAELLEMEEKRRQSSERMRTHNSNTDYYQGGSNVREDEESSKYPQGISEQVIENKNNSTTIRRIVVNGTQVDIYEKTLHAWGGVFFTKNGNNITEDAWDIQTSP